MDEERSRERDGVHENRRFLREACWEGEEKGRGQ